ncbi:phosphotransferase [Streptomyces sp. NPDC053367]|uniref:phosphotransferase n=1 Tax=Streptomyces sp. NPDC053367 TaxID=3365700 RepID=UPI0037CFDC43
MSGGRQRHREPVDVHLIARRDTAAGPEILLSRRAGEVYAAGLWHLPSGHLDGPHEDVVDALIREAAEETGLVIDRAEVRFAVVVHHRGPGGRTRTGLFFEVRAWRGTPGIGEPAVCDAMGWYGLDELPSPMVAYCRAGLDAYRNGRPMAVHFQEPDDPIACTPDADRLYCPPAVTDPASGQPPPEAREFAERAVGRVAGWTDVSWARRDRRVWRAHGAAGGVWFVKTHRSERFHEREVRAYRTWVPALGAAAPRLVATDAALRTVVVTAVPGRPLHGVPLSAAEERRVFHGIGALARSIHRSAARPDRGPAVDKAERHLAGARDHLAPGDTEFVRSLVERAGEPAPLECVHTHGDLQLRNILRAGDGTLAVIDFERSEPGPAVRDLVRLCDAWTGRPDLYEAFLAGYGRALTPCEQERLVVEAALDSVSGIRFGIAHGDPELVERGRRTLARLRAQTLIPVPAVPVRGGTP